MKIYQDESKWIWENEDFPNFTYIEPNLDDLYYKFGQLQMIETLMSKLESKDLLIDILENEAISTSAIEGELLQRSSVRSSINKILKLGLKDEHNSTYIIDALIEIIVDAKTNLNILDKDRLSSWHKALFPTNQSGLRKISAGSYRNHIDDMQIVSGPMEKEKVHYIAPPSEKMDAMMEKYLEWLNNNNEKNLVIKAGIAHLYFVLIHPFEDGNGRLTRAITDFVLAQAKLVNANFYSIASAIQNHRAEYYQMLDMTCKNKTLDITAWLNWFIKILHESIDDTLIMVEAVKTRVRFWDKHINLALNERQRKVIARMLSLLPNEFEGGMRVNKYMSLTKSIRVTASRDITDLVEKGIFASYGNGRGAHYKLIV